MKTFTIFRFFANALFFAVFFVGPGSFAQAQVLHSATDSVAPMISLPGQDSMGIGFRFSPIQTLYVDKLGKMVPDSGNYSWVIWDVATKTKLYQQNSQINSPAQYSYEDVEANLILQSGTMYLLEIYYLDSAAYYFGFNQMGQHLNIYEARRCNSCDTNTFPTDIETAFLFGFPDFLYSLLPLKRGMNDAAVISVDSIIKFCPGTKDVYANIGNYGYNQIDSVEIHWEFNGIPQPVVMHRQLLDTLGGMDPSTAQVLLGSKSFVPGEKTSIKVWTVKPNGIIDTTIYGDTLEVIRQAQLSGNFTIDSNLAVGNGNYHSFSDLAIDLNTIGVCGPVHVNVAPNIYHDFLHLKQIPGSSVTNTVTIDGQDSSITSLINDDPYRYATVALEGTDYLIIKNLGISTSDTSDAANIVFAPGTDHNLISNCELTIENTSLANIPTFNVIFSGTISGNLSGANASYNTIANNRIKGGHSGIRIYGSSSNIGLSNKIINNEISNFLTYGAHISDQNTLQVAHNKIDAIEEGNTALYSVSLSSCDNTVLSSNYLHGSVDILNGNTLEILNNMIISRSNRLSCIDLSYSNQIDFYNNSISSYGITPAMELSGNSGNLNVRNNIFSAMLGSAVYTDLSMNAFDTLDHNIYFTQGNNLASISGVNYTNLSTFQNAYPLHNNASLEGDPQFLAPDSNLHIAGGASLANDAGDNSIGILEDIDGDSRPFSGSTQVDIGADEFEPPSCPPPFDLTATSPTLDSISLSWNSGIWNPSFYQYRIMEENTLGTTPILTTSTDSLRVGNLKVSTGYNLYVRSICGRNDTSLWWGPKKFYTADTISYFEDFKGFNNGSLSNGWTSKSSSAFGTVWLSGTSARYGGPTEDHSMGTGKSFMFLNTSNPADSSELLSPPIFVDSNNAYIEFTFWYHMYGADMGSLNVFVETDGISTLITKISGQQQDNPTDPWKKYSTYLNGYQGKYIQLRFEGVKGTGFYSSMAIDDISLDTVPAVNAGIVELISPKTLCSGTFTPIVGLQNLGDIPIDSVKVLWEINGILSDSIIYTDTILPGDTAAVPLKNFTLNPGLHYSVTIYTKDPNSIADPVTLDDTLKLKTGLIGNYRISDSLPASDSTFRSFTEAALALNTLGVCGPVIITVDSASYNEAIVLKEITGASSTNIIVFDGQDSSDCILSHDGSSRFATWTFDGADYVTIKNMSIINTNTQEGATLLFSNTAEHNIISNNTLKLSSTSTSSNLSNILFSGSSNSNAIGADANYNILVNNKIEGGYSGVDISGSSTQWSTLNKIINNEISLVYLYGINARYQDSLELSNNVINATDRYSNSYGIYTAYSNNTLIKANYIHSEGIGLYYYNYFTYTPNNRKIRIANNIVVSDNSPSINLHDVDEVDFLHNSLYTNSNTEPALDINTISILSNYDVRNNIFSAKNGEAVSTNTPDYIFGALNNNLYHTKGDTLLRIDGRGYADLTAYQAASPFFNTNSIEGDPQFVSANDLHIAGTLVDGKGDNSVGIIEDIDGDPRPMPGSITVDMGADEFDPPSCPPVSNPTASDISPDSATLQWSGTSGYFEYEIVLKDSAQGTGMLDTTVFDSLRVGGLIPNTTYDYYIREICSAGDTSIWWGPITFSTPQAIGDLSIGRLISPHFAQDSCNTASLNSIELSIINAGNVPIDFSIDTADINLNVSGSLVQNYSYQINSNILNSGLVLQAGDSIVVSIGTISLINSGIYNFVAYIELDVDSKSVNDTLHKTITSTSGGILSAPTDSICGPGNLILTTKGSQGNLQWQRLVGGTFVNEIGADSTSYEVFIDSTTSFRVLACGTVFSDTLTVGPISLNQPNAFDSLQIVSCGDTAVIALLTTSPHPNAIFEWFDVPIGGTALEAGGDIVSISADGDTLYYRGSSVNPNKPAVKTFYVQQVIKKSGGTTSPILITEMDMGANKVLEIQNVSQQTIDLTGWTLAISNSHTDINQHTFVTLSGPMSAGTIFTWSDGTVGTPWPSNIPWINGPYPNYTGWILLLDDNGKVMDALFENWPQTEIRAMDTSINNHPVTITNEWTGNGVNGSSINSGLSFQRTGNSNKNSSSDFVVQTSNHGTINPGLFIPMSKSECISNRDTVVATIDCIVGVDETNNNIGKLSIYPNPSKGIFNITGENINDQLQITIYSPSGKSVYRHDSQLTNTFNEQIDVSKFAKGVYYLKIRGNDSFEMHKIIIN